MEKKQKNIAINLVIILLILITLTSSIVGIYAWSKYTSSINGTATAQIAKWSFKLVDGVTETTDVIDFAITRTDGYGKVVEGRLAPGTFGEFEIGIDARGTETILEYIINVELENKPTYLKLYSDEAKTQEILVEDNKFTVKGFMSLEDVKEIRTEKIYWNWPYESGDDVTDTADSGKTMTMKISVTGYEVLEQSKETIEYPVNLADVVSVGDYVNYDASSNGTKTFTSSNCLAGTSISGTVSTANEFNSEAPAQWRVLSVDKQNGTVQLMSADPTAQTVTISGGNGFVNSETVLNNIGAIYGNGKGATGGRSLTIKDIEQYSSYDKETYATPADGIEYGETRTYTSGTYYKEIKDEQGNVTGYNSTLTTATTSNPITLTQNSYGYLAESYISDSSVYNMIFKNSTDTNNYKSTFWLADRCVLLTSTHGGYRVRRIGTGNISNIYIYTNGTESSFAHSVIPVVSMESSIQTTGQDSNGVWQLKVD